MSFGSEHEHRNEGKQNDGGGDYEAGKKERMRIRKTRSKTRYMAQSKDRKPNGDTPAPISRYTPRPGKTDTLRFRALAKNQENNKIWRDD